MTSRPVTPPVSHTFAAAGEYEVVLRVVDADGKEATAARRIEVEAPTTDALAAPG